LKTFGSAILGSRIRQKIEGCHWISKNQTQPNIPERLSSYSSSSTSSCVTTNGADLENKQVHFILSVFVFL
jgi:hypothetical protein